jgi:hypothetical protein
VVAIRKNMVVGESELPYAISHKCPQSAGIAFSTGGAGTAKDFASCSAFIKKVVDLIADGAEKVEPLNHASVKVPKSATRSGIFWHFPARMGKNDRSAVGDCFGA